MCALVDTGACRSLVNSETWRDICRASHRPPLLTQGLALRSITGHVIPTKGKANINIYGRELEFYVVESMQHDMLLGNDALQKLHSNIDYEGKVVRLANIRHEFCHVAHKDYVMHAVYNELDAWMQDAAKPA